MTYTRAQAVALEVWTTINRRAAAEYAAHPIASCRAPDCPSVQTTFHDHHCPAHRAGRKAKP